MCPLSGSASRCRRRADLIPVRGGVDASACRMIAPPGDDIPKVPRDEETDLPRREAMIAHVAVHCEMCGDLLSGAPRVGEDERPDLRPETFESCLLLGSLSISAGGHARGSSLPRL